MPANLMMPLPIGQIDNGKLVARLQKKVDDAAGKLDEYRQISGDSKGKAVIILTIELTQTKDLEGHVDMAYTCESKLPKRKRRVYYKAAPGGKLLTEATAEAVQACHDKDQIQLFSLIGEEKGRVDPKTMEMIEEPAVAGSIGTKPPA